MNPSDLYQSNDLAFDFGFFSRSMGSVLFAVFLILTNIKSRSFPLRFILIANFFFGWCEEKPSFRNYHEFFFRRAQLFFIHIDIGIGTMAAFFSVKGTSPKHDDLNKLQ